MKVGDLMSKHWIIQDLFRDLETREKDMLLRDLPEELDVLTTSLTSPVVQCWKEMLQGVPDTPMMEKLRGMLDSVRERAVQQLISLQTLFSLLASEDDDDCMSDSDSESTTSSSSSNCFSDISAESMTSVSSSGSASSPKKTSVYVPPAKARLAAAAALESDSIPSHRLSSFSLSHSQRRAAPVVVTPGKPRTRYTYQGGETGVVTGGVMLGKAVPAASTAPVHATETATAMREPLGRSPRKHTGAVMLGPDSVSNWRRVRA
ncbi:hypothetical protein BT96DRAFT_1013417 [Gymnopus androsaceus JB14]|uniref:Uncharacterized protein n=1 Tax=Gymnopus androsaceus JB14 TaxID=1447944 RepID=A0A6A4IGD5_9AGAR|nr:hypothetical protein BT96DRAFT_1013417 [Gymnopus androsaceus JB14]